MLPEYLHVASEATSVTTHRTEHHNNNKWPYAKNFENIKQNCI